MDEIFFWIDETENILNSSIRPDEEYLEELMEKVKVGNLVSKFELINYFFVCFNLNNCSNTLRWYLWFQSFSFNLTRYVNSYWSNFDLIILIVYSYICWNSGNICSLYDRSSNWPLLVDPLSISWSSQYNRCNKDCSMYCPVSGVVHIQILLMIEKSISWSGSCSLSLIMRVVHNHMSDAM